MISNPTQRQIDMAIKNEDTVRIVKPSLIGILINNIIRLIMGIPKDYVIYKDKKFDSSFVYIYTKEEIASFVQREMPVSTCSSRNPLIRISKNVKVAGGIEKIIFDFGDTTAIFDYEEMESLMENIKTRYDAAVKNPQITNHSQIRRTEVKEYVHNGYKYSFLSGFSLDIIVTKNRLNDKIKIFELSLGVESDEYDNETLAFNDLSDKLEARIEILLNNKLCEADKLIKRERVGTTTDVKF